MLSTPLSGLLLPGGEAAVLIGLRYGVEWVHGYLRWLAQKTAAGPTLLVVHVSLVTAGVGGQVAA